MPSYGLHKASSSGQLHIDSDMCLSACGSCLKPWGILPFILGTESPADASSRRPVFSRVHLASGGASIADTASPGSEGPCSLGAPVEIDRPISRCFSSATSRKPTVNASNGWANTRHDTTAGTVTNAGNAIAIAAHAAAAAIITNARNASTNDDAAAHGAGRSSSASSTTATEAHPWWSRARVYSAMCRPPELQQHMLYEHSDPVTLHDQFICGEGF